MDTQLPTRRFTFLHFILGIKTCIIFLLNKSGIIKSHMWLNQEGWFQGIDWHTSRVLEKNCQWFIFIIFCSWGPLKPAAVPKSFVILPLQLLVCQVSFHISGSTYTNSSTVFLILVRSIESEHFTKVQWQWYLISSSSFYPGISIEFKIELAQIIYKH